jgi:hypothetical protein
MQGDFWNPVPSVPPLTDSQNTVKMVSDLEVMAMVSRPLKTISVQYLTDILYLLYVWIIVWLLFTYQFEKLKEVDWEGFLFCDSVL